MITEGNIFESALNKTWQQLGYWAKNPRRLKSLLDDTRKYMPQGTRDFVEACGLMVDSIREGNKKGLHPREAIREKSRSLHDPNVRQGLSIATEMVDSLTTKGPFDIQPFVDFFLWGRHSNEDLPTIDNVRQNFKVSKKLDQELGGLVFHGASDSEINKIETAINNGIARFQVA